MANEERDRYGDKLKESERGREDDYFARRDRELLAKMRARGAGTPCQQCGTALEAASEEPPACPKCGRT